MAKTLEGGNSEEIRAVFDEVNNMREAHSASIVINNANVRMYCGAQ